MYNAMNTKQYRTALGRFIVAGLLLTAAGARAQVPPRITYQGEVVVNGSNFTGKAVLRAALVEIPPFGFLTTRWSNDDTSVLGSQPTLGTTIVVEDGQFMIALGDDSLGNMVPIPSEVFTHSNLHLRLWFDDLVNGIELLTPDQPINSVGYAMMASLVADGAVTGDAIAPDAITGVHVVDQSIATADLADGSVTAAKLAPNSVNSSHIVNGSVTSDDVADTLALESLFLGGLPFYGRLDLLGPGASDRGGLRSMTTGSEFTLNYANGAPGLAMFSRSNQGGDLDVYQAEGVYGVRINGDAGTATHGTAIGGEITVHGRQGTTGVRILGEDQSGPRIEVLHPNQTASIELQGQPGAMRIQHSNGTPTVLLEGNAGNAQGGRLTLSQADGQEGAILYGATDSGVGALSLRDAEGQPRFQAWGGPLGGRLTLTQDGGDTAVELESDGGGQLTLRQDDGETGAVLYAADPGNGVGALSLRNDVGAARLRLFGGPAGDVQVFDHSGDLGVRLSIADNLGGEVNVFNPDGDVRASVYSFYNSEIEGPEGGALALWEGEGTNVQQTLVMAARDGGEIYLLQSDGTPTVILDADDNGNGRVTTQVLEITGGSDLSEAFDISATEGVPEPGMLVCIDPDRPGELKVSDRAYDHTLAGVISGAGGVHPGMLMGQAGSIADGEHPVALTGRVYGLVDAGYGAIEPGDLITSSGTPGHGMKVSESDRAHGAIVGKAMTGLSEGRGLVLLLVTLH